MEKSQEIRGIILDFDDVIVHTRRQCCKVYNNLYAEKDGFTEAFADKNYYWSLKDVCPLIDSVQDLAGVDGFYNDIEIYNGALEGIRYISERCEIIICTSGGYRNQIEKAKFIEKNMPYIKGTLFMTNVSKKMIDMDGYIFVDDNAFNLDETNATIKICLSSQIYECNSHWKGIWVKDWKELILTIDKNLK